MENIDVEKVQKKEDISLEGLLEIAGGQGKYQYFIIGYNALIAIFMAFIMISIGFIYYRSSFECYNDQSLTTTSPCNENILAVHPWGYIIKKDRDSLVIENKMYGSRTLLFERSQQLIGLYVCVVGLITLIAMEWLGRWWGYFVSLLMAIIGSIFNIIFRGYNAAIFGIGNMTCAVEVYYAISGAHTTESIGGNLRTRSTVISYCFFSASAICFYLIHTIFKGYRHIYPMVLVPAIISLVLTIWVKESHYFYHYRKNYVKMQDTLIDISRINNDENTHKTVSQIIIEKVRILVEQEKKNSVPLTVSWKLFIWKMIALMSIMGNLNFVYLMLAFIPQSIGTKDICLTGALLMAVEGIVYVIMVFFGPKSRRKLLNVIVASTLILSATFVIILKQRWPLIELMLFMLIKCALCINFSVISNYVAEMMPSELRGKTFILIFLAGRLLGTSLGKITSFSDRKGFNPVAFIIPFSLIALASALSLPETLNQKLHN